MTEWQFINADHERIYNEARAMLVAEIDRQRADAERLGKEWERYPEQLRLEKHAWLRQHFAECRRPYEKILTDILAICPRAIIVTKDVLAHTVIKSVGGADG